MSRLLLLVAVTAGFVGLLSAQESEKKDSMPFNPKRTDRALFGSYRTITRTGVSLATSTVYLTCLSGTSAERCLGKKRRALDRKMPDINVDTALQPSESLDGSINSSEEERMSPSENERLLGGAYTIWTTATTSTTVTVTYTDSAVTISISYYCTAANIEFPGIFCG